jgi:hypothetical protein
VIQGSPRVIVGWLRLIRGSLAKRVQSGYFTATDASAAVPSAASFTTLTTFDKMDLRTILPR